jgi:hypothetical protein
VRMADCFEKISNQSTDVMKAVDDKMVAIQTQILDRVEQKLDEKLTRFLSAMQQMMQPNNG